MDKWHQSRYVYIYMYMCIYIYTIHTYINLLPLQYSAKKMAGFTCESSIPTSFHTSCVSSKRCAAISPLMPEPMTATEGRDCFGTWQLGIVSDPTFEILLLLLVLLLLLLIIIIIIIIVIIIWVIIIFVVMRRYCHTNNMFIVEVNDVVIVTVLVMYYQCQYCGYHLYHCFHFCNTLLDVTISIIILLHSNQMSSWLVSLLSNLLTFSFLGFMLHKILSFDFYITWFEQTRIWPPKSPGLCMYQDIVQILRQNSKSRSPATFLCSNSENIRLQGFPRKDGKTRLLPWKVLTPKTVRDLRLKMGAYDDNGKSHHAWRWKMHFLLKIGIFQCNISLPRVYHIKHAKFFRHQLWIRHSARVAEKLSTPSHKLLRYSLSVQWLAHGIFMAHKIIRSHRGVSSCKTMSVKVKVSRASGPSQVMLRPSKQYTITTTTTQEKLQEINPVLRTDSKTLAFGCQQWNIITTFDSMFSIFFVEEPPLQLLEEISLSQNDRHNQLQAPSRTGWSGNDSPQVMAWNSFIVNGVNKNPCYPNTSQVDSG